MIVFVRHVAWSIFFSLFVVSLGSASAATLQSVVVKLITVDVTLSADGMAKEKFHYEVQVPLLPLSTRALNALERLGLNTVRDLLAVPVFRLHRLHGVGNKTRREIGRVVGILSKRLAAETQAAILREGGTEGTDEEPGFASLDLLAARSEAADRPPSRPAPPGASPGHRR